LQHRVDDLTGHAVQPCLKTCARELRSAHKRGRTHVRRGTQPLHQAGCPLRILDGGLAHQLRVADVALISGLVERVLADHVRDSEEEQLRPGVPLVSRAIRDPLIEVK
jgi:hypothetical protein